MRFFVFLFLAPLFAFADQADQKTPLRIFLDAGHGGSELGAVSSSVIESHLILDFAKELKAAFEKKTDHQITLSRETDVHKTLQERLDLAVQSKSNLFISLHANSAQSPKAQGIEVFFQPYSPQNSENQPALNHMISSLRLRGLQNLSLNYSKKMKSHFQSDQSSMQNTKFRIKSAPFYVLRNSSLPSILVEIGFLTHPRERQKLQMKSYRAQIAEEIIKATELFVSTHDIQKDFSDKAFEPILN